MGEGKRSSEESFGDHVIRKGGDEQTPSDVELRKRRYEIFVNYETTQHEDLF